MMWLNKVELERHWIATIFLLSSTLSSGQEFLTPLKLTGVMLMEFRAVHEPPSPIPVLKAEDFAGLDLLEKPTSLYKLRAYTDSPTHEQSKGVGEEGESPLVPWKSPPVASPAAPELTAQQLHTTLDYLLLCSERVAQMTKTYDDADALSHLLEEKEKDIELAARIGKSLLERNQELTLRNDYLEESLAMSNERLQQMQHDLEAKSEMMRLYSESQEALDSPSTSTVLPETLQLQSRLSSLEEENKALAAETSSLKELTCDLEQRETSRVADCQRQMETRDRELAALRKDVADKSEAALQLQSRISSLVLELTSERSKGRRLEGENAELVENLLAAQEAQAQLMAEVIEIQGQLMESGQTDSLYDSLASELEAADSGPDSGFHPSPCVSGRSELVLKALPTPPACLLNLAAELAEADLPTPSANQKAQFSPSAESIPEDPGLAVPPPRARTPSPSREETSPQASPVSDISASPPKRLLDLRREALGGRLSQKGSTDSLASYAGPGVGEPGCPGTRDLDFALRRHNLRRKVELDFQRFQKKRGYTGPPIPFHYPPRPASGSKGSGSQGASGSQSRTGLVNRWAALASSPVCLSPQAASPGAGVTLKHLRRSPPRGLSGKGLLLSPIKEKISRTRDDGIGALLETPSPVLSKPLPGVMLRASIPDSSPSLPIPRNADTPDYSSDNSVD